MPNAVWISTVGLLLFYETFILAHATSMSTRVRQVLAAQRDLMKGSGHWKLYSDYTVINAFVTESRICTVGGYRDYIYLTMLSCLALPDWKSIAFLAAGASIDLICAILYSVPSVRDFFGMPVDQQRAEPWATMAFLLVIWLAVIKLTSIWEKKRHEANESYINTEGGRVGRSPELEQLVCEREHFAVTRQSSKKKEMGILQSDKEDEQNSAPKKGIYRLMATFDHLSLYQQLVIALVIYGGIGIGIFFLFGSLVMNRLEGKSEAPWVAVLCITAILLIWQVYSLGKWRLAAAHSENATHEKESEIRTHLTEFAQFHKWAQVFHVLLVAFAVFIGFLATDRDYTDYLFLRRPGFYFTQNWEKLRDIQNNSTLKQLLINTTSAIGIDSEPKITLDYCASDNTLPIYIVLVCCTWSLLSALQHYSSSKAIHEVVDAQSPSEDASEDDNALGTARSERAHVTSWRAYGLLVLLCTLAMTWPSFERRGFGWQSIVVSCLVVGPIVLLLQVSLFGVWDLLPVCNTSSPTFTDSFILQAHSVVKTVRTYKWIEYTLSASLMHMVVCYVGGVTSAHELVLCVGCLAVSMLFANMSESELDTAECEVTQGPHQRKGTILSLKQRIDCEISFMFLSFFAKAILTLALTIPWLFAERGDYLFVPQACSGG